MGHIIRQDEHGIYLRVFGQTYRPQTPLDYVKKPVKTKLKSGLSVTCFGSTDVKFIKVHYWDDANARAIDEVWFSHGRYIMPTVEEFIDSSECWQPAEYRWS